MVFEGATNRYSVFNPAGYNIPKPKFLYYVNFVTTKVETSTLKTLSFFTKRIDRISMTYDVQEMNQYNKKRLVQTKLEYGPLSFAFHDTPDESAMKLIEAYNRYYYGDFDTKNNQSWNYDITSANFENTRNWGLKNNFTSNDQYFFDRIEVYEIYDQSFTQINFIHPKLINIDFQNLDQELGLGNEIMATARYEGIVVQNIAQPITPELSEKFGLPYVNDIGIAPYSFRRPGQGGLFDNLIPNISTDIFNNIPGFNTLSQTINSLINPSPVQIISDIFTPSQVNVFGSRINSTLADRLTFNPLGTTRSQLPAVNTRTAAGEVVRDISTATIDTLTAGILNI